MPFRSQQQEKAAFGGYLGKEMKSKAKQWAAETDQSSLPNKARSRKPRRKKK